MEFSIDFGTQTFATAPKPPPGPLYASVDGRASLLGNGEVVFFVPATGKSHVMTDQVLQALNLCREFRTLDEHVARVASGIEGLKGQHEGVRRVLEGLMRGGLLVSSPDLVQRFAAATALQPAPFFGVCIRACDRPVQLQRLLQSLLDYERRFSPRHRYLVLDDSRQGDSMREHQRLVREFGEQAGVSAHHVGREAWDRIAGRILREVPAGERLGALLQRSPTDASPRGGGIGKNLLTLLAAGQRYALLDDDFIFEFRRHPEAIPGLHFAGAVAPRTFASRDAALAAGEELEVDPIALHLALCGQRLGPIAARGGELALDENHLRGLRYGRLPALDADKRVLLTLNGHRGSAGASGMAWLLALPPVARAGLVSDRDTYLRGIKDPAVWYGARAYRVSAANNFTPFLVDNSGLMPCTSPFGRSEDALFGALATLCRSDAVMLETPFSVGHVQEAGRERQEALQRPETPDINLCLAELARHIGGDVHARDPALRLRAYAGRLRDLSAADDVGVGNYLREYLTYLRTTVVQTLQQALATTREPPLYWAADLRSLVERNGRAILERGVPRFAGWPADLDETGCVQRFRFEADALADGLERWPHAFEAAQSLHAKLLASI